MATEIDKVEQKFRTLKAEYIAHLPQKLTAIQDGWNSLKTRHSVEAISMLHRDIHALIGSSGTFGCSSLSQSARRLEESLRPLIEHSTQNFSFNTELAASMSTNIQELFSLVDIIQQELAARDQDKNREEN